MTGARLRGLIYQAQEPRGIIDLVDVFFRHELAGTAA
jgi:hypothetical protein